MLNLREKYGINFEYIPIITGPTASGKSSLAMKLCQEINGELVSCDSMQIYKYLNIGTAKPTIEDQKLVKHHMIDIIEPNESYSVNDYVLKCHEVIDSILSKGKMPVLCGGTGQYIQALYEGINYIKDPVDQEIIDKLYSEFEEKGIEEIYQKLSQVDPIAASKIHPNNTRRVIRAYAVFLATNKTFTNWNNESKTQGPVYPFKVFIINHDRSVLYDRINKRVDIMVEDGLLEEARKLYDAKLLVNSTAKQAIGYKEIYEHFDTFVSLEKAIDNIKLRSRHYAKRQLTWFRTFPELNLVHPIICGKDYVTGTFEYSVDKKMIESIEELIELLR